jgi:hypothetical protein
MTSDFTARLGILPTLPWPASGGWREPGIVPGSQTVQLAILTVFAWPTSVGWC